MSVNSIKIVWYIVNGLKWIIVWNLSHYQWRGRLSLLQYVSDLAKQTCAVSPLCLIWWERHALSVQCVRSGEKDMCLQSSVVQILRERRALSVQGVCLIWSERCALSVQCPIWSERYTCAYSPVCVRSGEKETCTVSPVRVQSGEKDVLSVQCVSDLAKKDLLC